MISINTAQSTHGIRPREGRAISNNVNNQLLDLYAGEFSSGAKVRDHIFLFSANPAADFWRF
jgi:hypothetical protein